MDDDTLSSLPTMGPDALRRSRVDLDEPSLGSAITQVPGKDISTKCPSSLGKIDQYQLVRKLGGGGFGVVYLAKDSVSGVDVALKTLHPLLKANPEEMEALRTKFALVSRLSHPNIATALVLHPCRDIAITDDESRRELRLSPGDSVMVMRYAPGVTLSKWRHQFKDDVVPLDLALEVARQIAAALDYAHSEKIVHRDIKPANVMVETLPMEASQPSQVESQESESRKSSGSSSQAEPSLVTSNIRVRILDFGLAAEIRSSMSRVSTEISDTSGTRPYMAPEQWLGKKQDGQTDQYALACVLYELLSGAPPFAGVFATGDLAIMERAITTRPPDELEGVPTSVNAALQKALAKDPKERFGSCGEFVQQCVTPSGSRTDAQRNVDGGVIPDAKPRHRVWPWLLAGAIAIALGVGAWRMGVSDDTTIEPITPAPPVEVVENAESQEKPVTSSWDVAVNKSDPSSSEEPKPTPSPSPATNAIAASVKKPLLLPPPVGDPVPPATNAIAASVKKPIPPPPPVGGPVSPAPPPKGNKNVKPQEKPVNQPLTLKNALGEFAGERRVVPIGSQEIALRWCPATTSEGWKGISDGKNCFMMGSPTNEEGRNSNEVQHSVVLTKGFWMGETEVTQGLWKEIMGSNPSQFNFGDDYPVETVSWFQCLEFVKKLNSNHPQDELKWALPTEAQWEYACRAGTTGAYGVAGNPESIGWHKSNSGKQTHQVAQMGTNTWGLCDMHGNVREWCADVYGTYPSGSVTNPGTGPDKASTNSDRVFRGGSWCDDISRCRSASRGCGLVGYSLNSLGFRVALVPAR